MADAGPSEPPDAADSASAEPSELASVPSSIASSSNVDDESIVGCESRSGSGSASEYVAQEDASSADDEPEAASEVPGGETAQAHCPVCSRVLSLDLGPDDLVCDGGSSHCALNL